MPTDNLLEKITVSKFLGNIFRQINDSCVKIIKINNAYSYSKEDYRLVYTWEYFYHFVHQHYKIIKLLLVNNLISNIDLNEWNKLISILDKKNTHLLNITYNGKYDLWRPKQFNYTKSPYISKAYQPEPKFNKYQPWTQKGWSLSNLICTPSNKIKYVRTPNNIVIKPNEIHLTKNITSSYISIPNSKYYVDNNNLINLEYKKFNLWYSSHQLYKKPDTLRKILEEDSLFYLKVINYTIFVQENDIFTDVSKDKISSKKIYIGPIDIAWFYVTFIPQLLRACTPISILNDIPMDEVSLDKWYNNLSKKNQEITNKTGDISISLSKSTTINKSGDTIIDKTLNTTKNKTGDITDNKNTFTLNTGVDKTKEYISEFTSKKDNKNTFTLNTGVDKTKEYISDFTSKKDNKNTFTLNTGADKTKEYISDFTSKKDNKNTFTLNTGVDKTKEYISDFTSKKDNKNTFTLNTGVDKTKEYISDFTSKKDNKNSSLRKKISSDTISYDIDLLNRIEEDSTKNKNTREKSKEKLTISQYSLLKYLAKSQLTSVYSVKFEDSVSDFDTNSNISTLNIEATSYEAMKDDWGESDTLDIGCKQPEINSSTTGDENILLKSRDIESTINLGNDTSDKKQVNKSYTNSKESFTLLNNLISSDNNLENKDNTEITDEVKDKSSTSNNVDLLKNISLGDDFSVESNINKKNNYLIDLDDEMNGWNSIKTRISKFKYKNRDVPCLSVLKLKQLIYLSYYLIIDSDYNKESDNYTRFKILFGKIGLWDIWFNRSYILINKLPNKSSFTQEKLVKILGPINYRDIYQKKIAYLGKLYKKDSLNHDYVNQYLEILSHITSNTKKRNILKMLTNSFKRFFYILLNNYSSSQLRYLINNQIIKNGTTNCKIYSNTNPINLNKDVSKSIVRNTSSYPLEYILRCGIFINSPPDNIPGLSLGKSDANIKHNIIYLYKKTGIWFTQCSLQNQNITVKNVYEVKHHSYNNIKKGIYKINLYSNPTTKLLSIDNKNKKSLRLWCRDYLKTIELSLRDYNNNQLYYQRPLKIMNNESEKNNDKNIINNIKSLEKLKVDLLDLSITGISLYLDNNGYIIKKAKQMDSFKVSQNIQVIKKISKLYKNIRKKRELTYYYYLQD